MARGHRVSRGIPGAMRKPEWPGESQTASRALSGRNGAEFPVVRNFWAKFGFAAVISPVSITVRQK